MRSPRGREWSGSPAIPDWWTTRPATEAPTSPSADHSHASTSGGRARDNGRVSFLVIAFCFALATGLIGRAKGASFLLWFLIGFVVPGLGLVAVILSRRERAEPERRCPRCGAVHKLYVQVCHRCGEDMYLPDVSEVRPGPDFRAPQAR